MRIDSPILYRPRYKHANLGRARILNLLLTRYPGSEDAGASKIVQHPMTLSAGTRLGPYEILAPIGAGGMGEVYRSKDTKLDREVAVKVLPAAFAEDPERLARFEREAKVLASLNHPNIATIHGVEESGSVRALVMELVPGESLKGPLPLETALNYAKQSRTRWRRRMRKASFIAI
jgi:serine/threonine protein kinase